MERKEILNKLAMDMISEALELSEVTRKNPYAGKKDHPHDTAMSDHESAAAEHRDNKDHPKAGDHHKLAHAAHQEAATHLEYGRKNDAKKAAARAVSHAKKAAAAGGKNFVKMSQKVHDDHH